MPPHELRLLEEDLPYLVRQYPLDLPEVAAQVAADYQHLHDDLVDVLQAAVIRLEDGHRWLQSPGEQSLQLQNLQTQLRLCGDVRELLATLMRRRRSVTTIAKLQLSALLQKAAIRSHCEQLLRDCPPSAVTSILSRTKAAIVEHGVARPFVHELLQAASRQRAFDLLHEAHIALGGLESEPDEVMATYVTEEILAYIGANEEGGQLGPLAPGLHIFGQPAIPFAQGDRRPPRGSA